MHAEADCPIIHLVGVDRNCVHLPLLTASRCSRYLNHAATRIVHSVAFSKRCSKDDVLTFLTRSFGKNWQSEHITEA